MTLRLIPPTSSDVPWSHHCHSVSDDSPIKEETTVHQIFDTFEYKVTIILYITKTEKEIPIQTMGKGTS